MTDTTIPLHPGALYTYRPEGFDCTILTEVIARTDDGAVLCENHLSSDKTPATPPLTATLDPASFGPTGEYVYAGDIRDHQNNPDVGDIFLTPSNDAGCDVVEILSVRDDIASVITTWSVDGHRIPENYHKESITEWGVWVGHTRPVFDTPERYAS